MRHGTHTQCLTSPPPPHPAQGFSLLELIVALVIVSIVGIAAFQSLASIETRTGKVQQKILWQEKMGIIFNSFYTLYHSSEANVDLVEKLGGATVVSESIALSLDNTAAPPAGVLANPPERPQHQLQLHHVAIESPVPSVYYRVINPAGTCYFSSRNADGSYGITCGTASDSSLLNNTMNTLFNDEHLSEIHLNMLDGRICKAVGHDGTNWRLSADSQCPTSITTPPASASASPTPYFLPPRVVLYASNGTLTYSKSLLANFARPIDR